MSTSLSPSDWPTVTALADTLSSALGVSGERGDLAVRWLAERDLIPATDQPASFDDAATLLIALATNTGEAPHRAVERFGGLPLGGIEHYEGWPVGGFAALPQDHPVVEEYRANFPTFRDCLAYWVENYCASDVVRSTPRGFTLAYGPGKTAAWLVVTEGDPDTSFSHSTVQYDQRDYGDGLPDDAPRARLELTSQVPETIFPILRELFTGQSDAPRVVPIAEAGHTADILRDVQGEA